MNKKLYKLMNWVDIEGITYIEEVNPFKVLGPKTVGASTLFQMFYPGAKAVDLIIKSVKDEKHVPMEMADEMGFFAVLNAGKEPALYEYEITLDDDTKIRMLDAYCYDGFEMSPKEADCFKGGELLDAYRLLGSHVTTIKKTKGVLFRVWAPNALSVSVIGDFNGFKIGCHQMKLDEDTGVFELFIPGIGNGAKYNYAIKLKSGKTQIKADPYGIKFSMDDDIATIVYESKYTFNDSEYIKRLKKYAPDKPYSIYEVSPLNYCQSKSKNSQVSYQQLANELADYLKDTGYTHVELLPTFETTDAGSCGYKTFGFYAANSKLGTIDDLKEFVDILHANNIGVIFDWAPYHFPMDELGLKNYDGTCLYEHLDPRKGIHPFYGTGLFNYGRPEVGQFLVSNTNYLMSEFHIDGIKIDSVASMLYLDYGRSDGEWIANMYGGNEDFESIDFIKRVNSVIHKKYPYAITIAQDDSGYPKTTETIDNGGLGFDLKLNNGFIQDALDYISYDPYFRKAHHEDLCDHMVYQYSEDYINSISHEYFINGQPPLYERIPGNNKEKLANVRMLLTYSYVHPGKKLVFQGQDIATTESFAIDKALKTDSHAKYLKQLAKELNKLYAETPALYKCDTSAEGFEWISCIDRERNILSFYRKTNKEEDTLLIVMNAANMFQHINIGTSLPGKYKEIFNSDSKEFGGDDTLNKRAISVTELESDGKPYSVEVKLAPLSVCVFKYVPFTEKEKYKIEKKKEAAIAKTRADEYLNEAFSYEAKAKEANARMEEAKKEMEEFSRLAKEAHTKSDAEIERAKRALLESK